MPPTQASTENNQPVEKTPTHLEWDIELPANTTGEVYLPGGRKEMVGSGKHHFSVDIPTRNVAILSDEFLYEKASFPECHGATIVELKTGILSLHFRRYQRAQSGLLHLGVSQAERCQRMDLSTTRCRRRIFNKRCAGNLGRH